MTQMTREQELLDLLEGFGDPRPTSRWYEGDPDYVATFNLTDADTPQLIELALLWATREDWPEDENDLTVYAPIHAWRSLGQLKAVEAVETFLEMLEPLDIREDDWFLEEIPYVLAHIGPSALPPVEAYLTDTERSEWALVCAAHAIEKIGKRHPEKRVEAVAVLTEALSRYEINTEIVNGLLICYLLGLKASESAEVIERAFAADLVDTMSCGNWNEVRRELGVEGMGLVPEEIASQRPPSPFALPTPSFDEPSRATTTKRGAVVKKDRRRANRKRERKNRKRGRRR